jgi:hypothetical protein
MEGGMKYTKVKFNVARIVKLYRAGKNVSEIAQPMRPQPDWSVPAAGVRQTTGGRDQ